MVDWRAYLRHLDYLLILTTVGLIAYSVTMVYFASRNDIDGVPLYYVRQQLVAVGVGLVGAVVITLLDYDLFRRFQWLLYAIAVLIVVAVLPLGQEVNGATRGSTSGSRASSHRRRPSCCWRSASGRFSPTGWNCSAPGE